VDNLLVTVPPEDSPPPLDPTTVWRRALDNIQSAVPKGAYDAWFAHARAVDLAGDRFTIEVGSSFTQQWLRDRYRATIEETLASVLGRSTFLEIQVSPELAARVNSERGLEPPAHDAPERPQVEERRRATDQMLPSTTAASAPQIPGSPAALTAAAAGPRPPSGRIQLNPRYTFETFVVGPSNEFAHAASKAISARPGTSYNPLFIYGGVGLGKTHLVQAIGHAVIESDPRTRVFYMSAEAWMNEMVSAIQNGTTLQFKEKFRGADFLLIDDVHFLSGKESTQQELFHTFNSLIDARKQIVLTSDRPASEIAELEERLVSRFQAGLVVDVQSPDLEMRLAILRKRAATEGIALDDDVTLLIADSVKSNVRELEGSLVRLLAYASLTGRDITLDLARQVLKDYLSSPSRRTTVEQIQTVITEFYSLPGDAMRSKRRTAALAHPRQIAMYLAREMTGLSLIEIGRKFGGRDHTTVIHACEKIRQDMESNPTVHDAVVRLRSRLAK
jgi:chromosomal replication initiator protein